ISRRGTRRAEPRAAMSSSTSWRSPCPRSSYAWLGPSRWRSGAGSRSVDERAERVRVRRVCGNDELARRVDLAPHVPKQEALGPPGVVDVADDALPVRVRPLDERLLSRVEISDGLVPEIEEVGVEERKVLVRRIGSGHVRADTSTVRIRMILVL